MIGHIRGRAAPFLVARHDDGELFLPGCFRWSGRVPLTLGHDPHRIIGEADTWADRSGLWFRAELPDTPTGRDVVAMLPRLAASVSFAPAASAVGCPRGWTDIRASPGGSAGG